MGSSLKAVDDFSLLKALGGRHEVITNKGKRSRETVISVNTEGLHGKEKNVLKSFLTTYFTTLNDSSETPRFIAKKDNNGPAIFNSDGSLRQATLQKILDKKTTVTNSYTHWLDLFGTSVTGSKKTLEWSEYAPSNHLQAYLNSSVANGLKEFKEALKLQQDSEVIKKLQSLITNNKLQGLKSDSIKKLSADQKLLLMDLLLKETLYQDDPSGPKPRDSKKYKLFAEGYETIRNFTNSKINNEIPPESKEGVTRITERFINEANNTHKDKGFSDLLQDPLEESGTIEATEAYRRRVDHVSKLQKSNSPSPRELLGILAEAFLIDREFLQSRNQTEITKLINYQAYLLLSNPQKNPS